jgi:Flp pilus assembly protein TadD
VRPAEPLVDAPDHAPAPQGRGSDDSHSLGREALDAGLVHRAVQLLRRAAALQPDVARIHADLAVAFLAVGSTPRAASAARRALEIAGTSSQHGAAEARQQALLVQVTLRGDR